MSAYRLGHLQYPIGCGAASVLGIENNLDWSEGNASFAFIEARAEFWLPIVEIFPSKHGHVRFTSSSRPRLTLGKIWSEWRSMDQRDKVVNGEDFDADATRISGLLTTAVRNISTCIGRDT